MTNHELAEMLLSLPVAEVMAFDPDMGIPMPVTGAHFNTSSQTFGPCVELCTEDTQ